MKEIINNVEEIKSWINNPLPAKLESDNDYMHFIMDLISYAHYLLKIGVTMAPDQKTASRGYTKHKAIIAGHFVRLVKLFHGFADNISKGQLELALILVRLMYECTIKIEYLFTAKRSTLSNFIFTSYKAEKETLENLEAIKAERPLMNIEKEIIRKIKSRLKRDNIPLRRLMANRNWKLDGKSFKDILKSLGKEMDYAFLFGQGSSFIHGGWYEMSIYNLEKHGRYYSPNLEFTAPDARLALPVTFSVLQTTGDFVRWNKSDPDNYIQPVISELLIKTKLVYDQYCNQRYEDV